MFDRIDGDLLSSSIEEAALGWAKKGVKVLFTWGVDENGKCTCGKRNCANAGKHPIGAEFPQGYKSATTDRKTIRRIIRQYEGCNLAIVPPDSMVVLDEDGPEGAETYAGLDLEDTATTRTGRGKHHYFRLNGAMPVKKRHLPHVDIKGSNGYVVVPPSWHRSCKQYRWQRRRVLDIKPLPAGLFSSERKSKVTVNFSEPTLTAGHGNRNNTLVSFAGYLRYRGLSTTAIEPILGAVNEQVCRPPLSPSEIANIATSMERYELPGDDAFMWLSDIDEEEVQFTVYPYLVKGAANLLDGHMGMGKSNFTTALATAITTGHAPDFFGEIQQGTVLFMSAEDDAARILKPRLRLNGADPAKIRFQNKPFSLDEQGLALLRQELEYQRPELVVIDPVIAYMDDGTDGNSANDTMRFIVKIDYLAREFDTCILLVRHFRKAKSDTPMHRGVGSIALAARVRSMLMIGVHPEDPDLRIIAHAKANYSKKGPSIIFGLESSGDRAPPKLVWHPPRSDLNEYDIVDQVEVQKGRPNRERETAMEFLRQILAKGPAEAKKVQAMAEARSISEGTLRRAREELGIITSKGKDGKSIWQLPDAE